MHQLIREKQEDKLRKKVFENCCDYTAKLKEQHWKIFWKC